MNLLTSSSIVAHSDDIVSREIEGELIIVPITSGIGDMEDDLFTLNDTGKEIWKRIDGIRTLKEIADDISQEYSASEGEIDRDVTGLVTELVKRKIVVVTG